MASYDPLDVSLIDEALLEETRMTVDLMVAAAGVTDHLSLDQVDAVLAVPRPPRAILPEPTYEPGRTYV